MEPKGTSAFLFSEFEPLRASDMGTALQETLLTIGALRERTRISIATLKRYADAGWIEHQIDTRGTRLFPPSAVEQARRVLAARTKRKCAA
jgi:hypothetical protein